MDQIKTIIEIGKYYSYWEGLYRNELHSDETGKYYVFHNDKYDENYKICVDAATEFINSSEVFSELIQEEIICMFANLKFKDEKVFTKRNTNYEYGMLCNHRNHHMMLFEELLKTNKEMLVALIKAVNEEEITYDVSYYFIGYDNKLVGKRQDISSDYIIELYRILFKYCNFNVDHLNLSNEEKVLILPTKTKKAV